MKKFTKILFFVSLLFITAGESYSQPIVQWIARFNGLLDSTDVSKDITVDNAGNTYVTGYSYTLLGLLTNVMTISYDPSGNIRWSRDFGGLLNDQGAAITLDNTQQYVYVTGFTNALLNLTAADYVIIKYRASDGFLMWSRTYNNGILGDDKAAAIAMDSQNNPVITGSSQGFLLILTPTDYATIKYDQAGNQQWVRRYDGTGNNTDHAYAIVVDNADNVIVTGESMGSSSNYDYATVKYNSAGTQQWARRYNGPGNDEDHAYAIVVDNSDNAIVTGDSKGSGSEYDYATVKYDPSGTQQWAGRYNGPGNNEDHAYAIVVDNSDNTIVTGESMGSGSGMDYATVKYTPSGSEQWAGRYNGTGNSTDHAYAIVVDNADNVFVTGSSRSGSTQGTEDFATLLYTPNGTQQWATRYNGTGNNEDHAYAIVVDNLDNVYITGTSMNGSLLGSEDYLTIKYSDSELSGIHPIGNSIPFGYGIFQNYPNPFNPSTKIKIDVAEYSPVKLAVYDILGVEKDVLIDQNLKPGTYEVQWLASGFSSGIYFYRISMNGYSATGRMILIK